MSCLRNRAWSKSSSWCDRLSWRRTRCSSWSQWLSWGWNCSSIWSRSRWSYYQCCWGCKWISNPAVIVDVFVNFDAAVLIVAAVDPLEELAICS